MGGRSSPCRTDLGSLGAALETARPRLGDGSIAAARMKDASLGVDTLILVPVLRGPEQVDRLAEAVAALAA